MTSIEFDPERVKRLRTALGWSQEELAFEAKVTQGTVSQWESGKAKPSRAPVLQRLLDLELKASID